MPCFSSKSSVTIYVFIQLSKISSFFHLNFTKVEPPQNNSRHTVLERRKEYEKRNRIRIKIYVFCMFIFGYFIYHENPYVNEITVI